MDLGRIKGHGTSTTRMAWLSNPLRSMLWRLAVPYFQGFASELALRRLTKEDSLRDTVMSVVTAQLDAMRKEAMLQMAGMHKDAMAVAHRMAGLEEELARAALSERLDAAAVAAIREEIHTSREEIHKSVQSLGESISNVAAEAHEAASYVASLHQEARASSQLLDERISSVTAEAHEAGAYVASLHQDVRTFVQSVNDRIDLLTREAPLNAEDRASIGQDDLVLVSTPVGTRFLVRQHDLIGHLIANGGEWEPHVRLAIERAARPDGVAVDAGANIGLHSVTMSRWFRTVHAFEPQLGIFHVLCGNLALNGRTNVIAHNLALYDRAGPMRLASPERQEIPMPMVDGQPDYARIANAAALTFEFEEDGCGDVRAVALDDLALEGVALIKVDTQGADLRVLRGSEATIRRSRPVVLFEWERDFGRQHGADRRDYWGFFAAQDYKVDIHQETSPGRQVDYIALPH